MALIADRFARTGTDAIDLATGTGVALRVLAACDAADERRWAANCARLAGLWHEDMPSLLDYGTAGAARFEAFELRPRGRWTPHAATAVTSFLEADATCSGGAPARVDAGCAAHHAVRLGLRLIARPPLRSLVELLHDGRAGEPLYVVCLTDPGRGASTFLRLAASEARRCGYVPVTVAALERPDVADLVRGKHVLIIADTDVPPRRGERLLLRACGSAPAAHVLLRAVRDRTVGADVTLSLAPLDADALVKSLHWYPPDGLSLKHVRRAAAESGGAPGLFVSMLRQPRLSVPVTRVAEARPVYAVRSEASVPAAMDHPWTDLIARADRLLAQGRRAAAERELRRTAAAARRRQMLGAAVAAETRLGELLLQRGRVDEAQPLLAGAQTAADRDDRQVEAALALAAAHVMSGALEAAETVLRAARACGSSAASLALARCLCWQARYLEAERVLWQADQSFRGMEKGGVSCVKATIALARQDLPAAAREATAARAVADDHDDAGLKAAAHEKLAVIHGRIGDAAAAALHARSAMAAARRAGQTVRLFRIRATAIEARATCGIAPDRRAVDRLLRAADRLPPLARARIWLMGARVHPSEAVRQALMLRVDEAVRATGARGLVDDDTRRSASIVTDLSALLEIQEKTCDPRALLQQNADWLRHRIGARGVHIVSPGREAIVRSGAPEPVGAVSRVLLTLVPQPPWNSAEGLEAAVPVRYGARVAGAIGCRWAVSATVDPDVLPLLTAAAAIAAPALATLLEQQARATSVTDHGIVGRSTALVRLRDAVGRAAAAPFPVLVEGESGVGKELVARAIHATSNRRSRPCVAINCAALGDDLFEAELFGHVRGAFTGAHGDRPGLFEQADGGTLFLDEVSELSPRAQAKLLRALQEGEVRRVGENVTRRVDARIVAASNRSLSEEVNQGRFRRDLLFRLAVVRISVPPLRSRAEDIPLLAAHCWRAAAERAGSRAVLTPAAIAALARYEWPGNVRELQNVLAAIAVDVPRGRVGADVVAGLIPMPPAPACVTLEEARRASDRHLVASTLAQCGGRHAAAARQLGVSRQGLAKLMRRLGMDQ